ALHTITLLAEQTTPGITRSFLFRVAIAHSSFLRACCLQPQYFTALSPYQGGCEAVRSNQSMKPTALPRYAFSVFATTPWISSRSPASLVRFASSPSRTPAVMLFNASCGLSLSRSADSTDSMIEIGERDR